MATLKQLYNLIHSLDKAEKKNLSLFVQAMGGKGKERYLKSIQIINEHEVYDAEKLKLKLSKNIQGMNLSEANDNVFNIVCKFITGLPLSSSAGNISHIKELQLIEFFVSKSLFDLAEKSNSFLIKKLQKGNSFGILIRAQELQSIIAASYQKTTFLHDYRNELLEERYQTSLHLSQYHEILRLNEELIKITNTIGEPRNELQLNTFKVLLNNPILSKSIEEISNQSFSIWTSLKIEKLSLFSSLETAIDFTELAIQEFNVRFNIETHFAAAFYLFDSLLSDCLKIKDTTKIKKYLPELEKLIPHVKNQAILQKVYAKIMLSELSVFVFEQAYSNGIQRIKYWMHPNQHQLWKEAPLAYLNYFFSARIYYLNHEPSVALEFLIAIQTKEQEFRIPHKIQFRFLLLLCYYNLNSLSLVYSTANSLNKYLKKNENLFEPEKAILRFVKSSGSIEKLRLQIKTLYNTLKKLQNDPFHSSFFYPSDYTEWLEIELKKLK